MRLVLSLLLGFAVPCLAAPPVNNLFANATDLGSTLPVAASNTNSEATYETGEPQPAASAQASIWWKWTAPATAHFMVDTKGSSPDTILGIYTGTAVDALTTIATHDNISSGDNSARIILAATAGTVYRMQVSSTVGRGSCRLNIVQRTPQGSDAFTGATDLGSPATAQGSGFISAMTFETGEPKIPTGFWDRSLWWRWTAPASQVVEVNTVGSGYNTALAVYTGSTLNALIRVAWNNDIAAAQQQSRVRFPATAGVTYLIQVAGSTSSVTADTKLEIKPGPVPPANDSFANAALISGSGPIAGTNVNATLEVGEPTPVSDQVTAQSVWWRWVAPAGGQVDAMTAGSGFNTILTVCTGTSVANLTVVGFNDDAPDATNGDSKVTFNAVPGQTYYLQVTGRSGPAVEGAVALAFSGISAGALNDDFSAATNLGSAATQTVTGSNFGATLEAGEPAIDVTSTASVWWRWTATATGPVEVNTAGSEIECTLGVFTGTSFSDLALMISDHRRNFGSGESPLLQAMVRFQALAGTSYYIRVTGYDDSDEDPDQGAITLTVKPGGVAPANDNFAAAINLGNPANVAVSVDASLASVEAGEPVPASDDPQLWNDWTRRATLWWKWTAPVNGWVAIRGGINPEPDTTGTRVAVYSGTSLANLQQLPDGRMLANAGTTYLIQAMPMSPDAVFDPLMLDIHPLPDPPANDHIASAINLGSSSTLNVSGTTANSSTEPGETNPRAISEIPLELSVWYRWTSSITGRVQVTATGSDFAAYAGYPSIETSSGRFSFQETPTGSTFEWQVIAGVEYYIQAYGTTLNPEGLFDLQVSSSATSATGYAGWVQTVPGFGNAQHHPDGDPDHDGVQNGIEYALGMPANAWQSPPGVFERASFNGNSYAAYHFTFPQSRATLVNALLRVEESTDLKQWTTVGEELANGIWIGDVERWTDSGVTHLRVRASQPLGARPRVALRLGTQVVW